MRWYLVLLLVAATALSSGDEQLQQTSLSFLKDYITVHQITRVVFIKNEEGKADEIPRHWLKSSPAFTKVISSDQNSTAGSEESLKCREKCSTNLIVMQLKDDEMEKFLKIFKLKTFRKLSWIIIGLESLRAKFAEIFLPMDNLITIATYDASTPNTLQLWEGYKAGEGLKYHETNIGSWSSSRGLVQIGPREPYSRRDDWTGLHLRVTTIEFAPFVSLTDKVNGTVSIEGNNAQLFNVLMESLNFTATFSLPADGSWGALDPETGMMSGMIGALQRREADIALCAIDMTSIRSLYVDYPIPLDNFGYYLVMKKPGQDADWKSYTIEFTTDAWFLIFGVLAILVLFIFLITKYNPNDAAVPLSDAVIYAVSAFCNMGFPKKFASLSSRIIIMTLFITTIIIYTYYSSFLIAALTVVKIKMPFYDIQGLYMKRKDYRIGLMGDSSLLDLFRLSKDPFLHQIWTDMLEPHPEGLISSNALGLQLILTEPLVFLTYAPTYMPSEETVNLKKQYFSIPYSWPVQKDSPLLPVLNYQFRKWKESGLYRRFFSKIVPMPTSEEGKSRQLGFNEIFTAFVIFGVGAGLALIASSMEFAFNRYLFSEK